VHERLRDVIRIGHVLIAPFPRCPRVLLLRVYSALYHTDLPEASERGESGLLTKRGWKVREIERDRIGLREVATTLFVRLESQPQNQGGRRLLEYNGKERESRSTVIRGTKIAFLGPMRSHCQIRHIAQYAGDVELFEPVEHLVTDAESGIPVATTLVATIDRADKAPVGSQGRKGDVPKLGKSQLNAIQDIGEPSLLGVCLVPEHCLDVIPHSRRQWSDDS